ncbi:MAG: ATP-binding protein, partial [Bacteroidota bacterium]
FKVIASNNDNVWNEDGAEISFTISPPPWFSWWAYTIYTVLFIIIIYAIRYQIRHEEKMKNAIQMERLEKNQQEKLTQMKLRFFTNISHEFKTPLTLIIGPLEQLLSQQHGNSLLKQKLSQISVNSKKLLELINQLIDFRRMEQDVLPLNKSSHDLIHTVQKTMSMFTQTAVENKIQYSLDTEFEQLTFNYDSDKIEKVLSNILANAFKHCHSNGNIDVSINLNREQTICIAIADTGRGMSSEKLAKVFERFRSNDRGSEDNLTHSSGIGLAYSKKLMEIHGGKIKIDSEEGKGTTVKVLFPYDKSILTIESPYRKRSSITETVPSETITPEQESPEANDLSNAPRILVVDDDSELRAYVRSILNMYYKIDEAVDGQVGLEMANNSDYDLIISDVMMPRLSGTEMCEKLKSNINTSHIHVALLTAKSDLVSKSEGYKTGADYYIGKPFLPQQLKLVVANILKTRQYIKNYYASGEESESEPIGISKQDKELILKAIQIVEENLNDDQFSIDMLGKELGLSRTNLYRKLKSLTGLSPSDYIRQIRLKKAADLIKTSDLPISSIAYDVGFKSPANFSTAFKAFHGMSPKEYQAKNRSV